MNASSLGYITLSTQDVAVWKTFGPEVLGLMLDQKASDDTALYFRMDDHPSRLIIQQGKENRLIAAGWELADKESYEAMIAKLESAGQSVVCGNEVGAQTRGVVEYASSFDPAGNPFEIYHSRTGLKNDFVSPQAINEFVTGDMGMGHLVVHAPNMDETHNFYRDVLGFGDSDDLRLPGLGEDAPEMKVRFLHGANPRHHSLVLFNYPVASGIVPLILEVNTIDEVGACFDRVQKVGFPLMSNLGRHCNDNMLSFYVVGSGGFAIEFDCEGKRFDWDNFEPTVSDFWGHDYVPLAVA